MPPMNGSLPLTRTISGTMKKLSGLQSSGAISWYRSEKGYHANDAFASICPMPVFSDAGNEEPLVAPLQREAYPMSKAGALLALHNEKRVHASNLLNIASTIEFYFDEKMQVRDGADYDFEALLFALDEFDEIYSEAAPRMSDEVFSEGVRAAGERMLVAMDYAALPDHAPTRGGGYDSAFLFTAQGYVSQEVARNIDEACRAYDEHQRGSVSSNSVKLATMLKNMKSLERGIDTIKRFSASEDAERTQMANMERSV